MVLKDIFIYESETIKGALKKLDKTAKEVLLVVDEKNRLLGAMTDGDIRRYVLSGKSLENDIKEVYNKNPIYIKKKDFSEDLTREVIIKSKVGLIPILDEENRVVDLILRDQMLLEGHIEPPTAGKINIPVVIMAGGKGARLDPFTKILPKPLIPIGNKPIAEVVIEEFKKHGVKKFYLTLNHKSAMIEAYFDGIEKDYQISYIKEGTFLGTAGSLKFLEEKISDIFIVSNCDVIVKANFEEVLNFHREQKTLLTILSPIQHYRIPYGVVKFKEGGEVEAILEKPEYTFSVNAGVYILNKESLQFIPEKRHFDMTDLIKTLIGRNKKVVMYPVNEHDYIDVGQWDKYHKVVDSLRLGIWQ